DSALDLASDDFAEEAVGHRVGSWLLGVDFLLYHGSPGDALQVVANSLDAQRPARADEPPDVVLLPEAELHHEPAARRESVGGGIEDAAHVAEAVGPAEERDVRLVPHVAGECRLVAVLHVRRVGDDQIEWTVDAGEIRDPGKLDAIRDVHAPRV